MKRLIAPTAAVAVMAAAVAAFVNPWEGNRLTPYKDIVGVWTWCAGITSGVRQDHYTPDECRALNKNEAAKQLASVARCVHRPLTEGQWVALGSWAYNVGSGAACGSTLMRKLNAGQPWCADLLRWDYAGGRKVRGLTLRRQAEYEVCIA